MPNHDESTNYLAYPTLMPLPVQQDRQPDGETDQIQRLLAELQLHTAEIQRHAAELARIEAELQRLQAARQTENADTAGSNDQSKPAPAQKDSVSDANSRSAVRALRPKKKPTVRKNQNVLGNVGNVQSELSLDGVTAKANITEIRFLDTLKTAPKGAVDLSEAKDGSVLCWTVFGVKSSAGEGNVYGVQYIAGEGGVAGGKSCAYLFAGYRNMTAIRFNGNFDTSRVTSMVNMFYNCHSLTALDLSGWDTSNVSNIEHMFYSCWGLTALNLSGWDTSHVTDMRWMFRACSHLKALNLSGWDTSHVTDMSRMFFGCISLTDFDPKWLDTSHADTTDMYEGTRWNKKSGK